MTDPPEPRHLPTVPAAARRRRGARRRRRRGDRRLREHDDAGGRRAAPAAAAKGLLGDPTAGGPVDAAGHPARAARLPGHAAEASATRSRPAKPEPGGELRIYNYADYLDPAVLKAFGKADDVSVRVTTFETLDEAFSKLSTGGLEFDVIFSTPDQLSRLVGRKLIQPLNYDLIPNLQKNVWPEAVSPFYDVGPRYSVPYVVYTTGIGWRNDIVDYDPASCRPVWDALWARDGRARQGPAAQRPARGDRHGDHAQRQRRPQHREPGDDRRGRRAARASSTTTSASRCDLRLRVAAGGPHRARAGVVRRHAQRRDQLPARGHARDVLSYAYQEVGGPVFNDIITVASAARKPVLAHKFLNYMLEQEGRVRQLRRTTSATSRRRTSIDATSLFDDEVLPAEPADRARHARGLRERQRLPDAHARGTAALGPRLGEVQDELT